MTSPNPSEAARRAARDIIILAGAKIMELNVAGRVNIQGLTATYTQTLVEAIIQAAINESSREMREWIVKAEHLRGCALFGFRDLSAIHCTCGRDEALRSSLHHED